MILAHRDALSLTPAQLTAIRAAVVDVQGQVAAHEWDLREAYQQVLAALDSGQIDEDGVMENVEKALLAENEVKKMQVRMLIRLKNLLTNEQISYLQSLQ